MRRNLFLLAILASFFLCCMKTHAARELQSVNVKKALSKIPKEDRDNLEFFFRYYLSQLFGYVIFGDKPMVFATHSEFKIPATDYYNCYPATEILEGMSHSLHPIVLKIKKGWETWQKYQHLFPSSNIIFKTECFPHHAENWVEIICINKKTFIKTVTENIDEFKKVLGQDITPESLLQSCLIAKNFSKDVLKKNHGLLGILLGFGKHNALLFERRSIIDSMFFRKKIGVDYLPVAPSEGFNSIEEEQEYLTDKLKIFDERCIVDANDLFLTLPQFVADHSHPETHALKKKYQKQYLRIRQEYKKGDFLTVTLERLCSCNTNYQK